MYRIIGRSSAGIEEIDTAITYKQARALAAEYKLAFGEGWTFMIVPD